MKKVLSILLAAAMIFSFAACGGSGGSNDPGSSAVADGAEETGGNGESANAEDGDNTEDAVQDQPLQVLIDDDNCTLAWTGYEVNENGDSVIQLHFVNKLDDMRLVWGVDADVYGSYVCVNGYQLGSYVDYLERQDYEHSGGTAYPGESSDASIMIRGNDLKALGMTSVDRLDLPIFIRSVDDGFPVESLTEEVFTLYPTGLDEASFTVPERSALESDRVVGDNEAFKFIVIGTEDNEDGYMVHFFVQNNTDDTLEFEGGSYSLNGGELIKLQNIYQRDFYVEPKSKGLFSTRFNKSYLDNAGITEKKELVFNLYVRDLLSSNYDHRIAEGTITIDLTQLRKLN